LRAAWAEAHPEQPHGNTIGSTQQLPAFAAKVSTLTDTQRGWLDSRLKDGPVRQVTCNVYYSTKTTPANLAIYKARARNTCQLAKDTLAGIGRTPVIVVRSSMTTKTADLGKVYLTFKD
jgi:glucose-6-phosphate dehydrogenase assembly protein OpcA